jgi:hypothetical protein
MTFFYDLNKKLDSIREKPEVTHGQLNERDMSRAAKGYEKYGKQGMEALAKAGREGRALDPIRKKYDKYDEGIEDRIGDLDMTNPVNQPAYQRKAAAQGGNKVSKPPIIGNRREGYPRMSGGGEVAPMPKSKEGYPRFSGGGGYTGKGVAEEGSAAMTPKQKSFAKLAPPADKITFADKIAGAKKEVDEMLGDVAAEAMKSALSGGQKKLDKNDNGQLDANDFEMLRKGAGKLGSKAPQAKVSQHSTLKPHSNPKSGLSGQVPSNKEETDEGWDDMMKDAERRRSAPKIGSITHGSKHDVEEIPGGRRVTRRVDPNTGHSVGTDDDAPADGEKRGRGRPKGTKSAIGAKGPSGRSKLMNKEADHDEDPNVAKAKAILKKAGYTVSKDGEEDLEEKAVSKKQQRFMGMVHATQKGEKAPSKEVAKVAKSMGKKDAEDFASTKHKGLPEKKKSDDAPKKKKEKTEEAGGTGTPTASSGFSYGKGIYDSMNHELESMIAEGMNVNMSMNSDAHGGPSKSLTVTATDDDALKLGKLLKMAGLGDGSESGYGGSGYQSACGDQEMDEAYGDTQPTLNEPDYPTNTETSTDALQYSGGLNKPKSTGQSTVPVLASQEERQESYAEAEEDALHRMMEMAGQPASGMGAQVGDMIDYVNPNGEEPPEELVMQSGVQYDPDTKVISVPNSTQMANTHRAIEAAGWKKQTAAARPNPMASRQAQVAGDVPYQLGEQDAIARMMEMAGQPASGKEDLARRIYRLASSLHTQDRMYAQDDPKSQAELDQLQAQFTQQYPGEDAFELGSKVDRARGQDERQSTAQAATLQKARQGIGGMYESEENQNDTADADLKRMREMAGIKEAKKVDKEKTEEGNKFTKGLEDDNVKIGDKIPGTNAIKKKDIDEGILASTANLWKQYKGNHGV